LKKIVAIVLALCCLFSCALAEELTPPAAVFGLPPDAVFESIKGFFDDGPYEYADKFEGDGYTDYIFSPDFLIRMFSDDSGVTEIELAFPFAPHNGVSEFDYHQCSAPFAASLAACNPDLYSHFHDLHYSVPSDKLLYGTPVRHEMGIPGYTLCLYYNRDPYFSIGYSSYSIRPADTYSHIASDYKIYYPKPFKKACEKISYKKVARSPDDYEDHHVQLTGYVFQVSGTQNHGFQMLVTDGKKNSSNRYMVFVAEQFTPDFRLLVDDHITVYGIFTGMYTYESIGSGYITVPCIKAHAIDLKK